MQFHYLAYGSNLHPIRMQERLSTAREVGVVTLLNRAVRFQKRSDKDGSGKCDLVDVPGSTAHAVLYEIDSSEKATLDRLEGKGKGYREVQVEADVGSDTYSAISYVAMQSHIDPTLIPYDWYRDLVAEGARYHGFPQAYVSELSLHQAVPDPDSDRAADHERLLKLIRAAPPKSKGV